MKRYFSSFFIALTSYAFVGVGAFYLYSTNKIVVEKPQVPKMISINHIELKPQVIKEVKEQIQKEPVLKEIKKETPKPKPIEKKKIEKPIEKKLVKKEPIKTKELVKEIVQHNPKAEIKDIKPIEKKIVIDERKVYLDKHLAQIRNLINQNVKYPKRARKLSIEGIVIAKFKINENGQIENITIIEGHKFLQKATIEAIQEASKSFPKTNKSIEIQIPIEYKLI
uniref:TonB family protein n=1 Tax=Aliarcobacter sp. TaxID=2321116 RepID=UPI004047793F